MEESPLEHIIGKDICGEVICPMASVVDMLIMCLVSKKSRQIFKLHLASIQKFVLYAVVSCKGCGHLDWLHWCRLDLIQSPCCVDKNIIEVSVGDNMYVDCLIQSLPIQSICFTGIEDDGNIFVLIDLKDNTTPNWGGAHIDTKSNQLAIQISFTKNVHGLHYQYEDGGIYWASRFHHAMICDSEKMDRNALLKPLMGQYQYESPLYEYYEKYGSE